MLVLVHRCKSWINWEELSQLKEDVEGKAKHWKEYTAKKNEEITKLKEILRDMKESLGNWLDWESEQIKKDGDYVGEKIKTLINNGRVALEKHKEILNNL